MKTLLLIFGPPAVGKMSVGQAVADRSDFRLFHNHHTIEPLIEIFGFGTPGFNTLNVEFRCRVIEEAAANDLDICVTFVWGLDLVEDRDYVEKLLAPYAEAKVRFVELAAPLDVRLERNRGATRLDRKPSKRNLEWSDDNVRDLDRHQLNTVAGVETPADELLARWPHLVIDNTELNPDETAEQILAWLDGR